MAKVILPYTANNKLNEYILNKYKQTGQQITRIEEELAEYCGITQAGIKAIKHSNSIPSLPIALKIAEWFNVSVESMFSLKEEEKE